MLGQRRGQRVDRARDRARKPHAGERRQRERAERNPAHRPQRALRSPGAPTRRSNRARRPVRLPRAGGGARRTPSRRAITPLLSASIRANHLGCERHRVAGQRRGKHAIAGKNQRLRAATSPAMLARVPLVECARQAQRPEFGALQRRPVPRRDGRRPLASSRSAHRFPDGPRSLARRLATHPRAGPQRPGLRQTGSRTSSTSG